MTLDCTAEAIEKRFLECWEDRTPVEMDNYPFNGEGEWVRLTINHGETYARAVNRGACLRTMGMVHLQIFTPKDSGTGKANQHAQKFKDIFENKRLDNIIFYGSTMVNGGAMEQVYMTKVSIAFQWDQHN